MPQTLNISVKTVEESPNYKTDPNFQNHKLYTVAENLGIALEHHHNALDDAVAAANILIYESQQFGDSALKSFVKNK